MRRSALLLAGVLLLAACAGSVPVEVAAGPPGDTVGLIPNAPVDEPRPQPWMPGEDGVDLESPRIRPLPPAEAPDAPVEGPARPGEPGGGPGGEPPAPEPELREPVKSAVGARPVAIERFEVRDERTIRAVWWGGVEPCHVLADVEVTETDDEVRVRLLVGSDPAAGDTACIMVALPLAVDIELERDLGERALIDDSTGERH